MAILVPASVAFNLYFTARTLVRTDDSSSVDPPLFNLVAAMFDTRSQTDFLRQDLKLSKLNLIQQLRPRLLRLRVLMRQRQMSSLGWWRS